MKHVGFLKKLNSKVIVVYKTIPGDPESSLVLDRDALRPFEADIIIPHLESPEGQEAFDFGDYLAQRSMPTDDITGENLPGATSDPSDPVAVANSRPTTVLAYLHAKGLLIKQPTYNVIMTPEANVTMALDELNKMIADQRGVKITDLAPKDAANLPKNDPQKIEAKNMFTRAERMIAQAEDLKERAYKLDETLRPKKGRPKKETVEA
jgi:hypothetical protein